MSGSPPTDRRRAIAWACIELLATQGARGLTHRAVDQLLALPPGSTSYYFRTTAALWQAASDVLTEADRADVEAHLVDGTIDTAGLLATWTSPSARTRLVARFEIYLMASRDQAFQAHIVPHRQMFLALVTQAVARTGCPDPQARARDEVALFEGRLLQHAVFAPGPGAPA